MGLTTIILKQNLINLGHLSRLWTNYEKQRSLEIDRETCK